MMGLLAVMFLIGLAGSIYPFVKLLRRKHFGALAAIAFVGMMIAVPKEPKASASQDKATNADTKEREQSSGSVNRTPALTVDPASSTIEQMKKEIASMRRSDTGSLTSKEDIMVQLAVMSVRANLAKDASSNLSPKQRIVVREFKTTAASWQTRMFPRLRMAQGELFKNKLWEHDIDVRVYGPANKNVRFVGGVLAANAAKKTVHDGIAETLRLLRFDKDLYQWYRGSEGTYWTQSPVSDSTLATIGAAGWKRLSSSSLSVEGE